jgi:RecB family exonuclease
MNEDEWERCMDYIAGLPYDLYNEDLTLPLVEESDVIEKRRLKLFLEFISHRMTHRVQVITQKNPYDARIAQLKRVSEMADALLSMIDTIDNEELSFTQISQWAQALYESSNHTLYNAQINSRRMIQQPANMIDKADNTIWCDFYGDVSHALSTDFLSNHEQEQLKTHGVHLWDKQHESDLQNMLLARPVYKTKKNLTIVTCEQQGATKLSMHPLYLQLPYQPEPINGDELYAQMATKEIQYVDNHREEDDREITFDAENHPVSWRSVESYSALEKLLQNPFDYFMNYTLHFTDINDNEIKPSTTYGNVAHDVIEYLFTAERDGMQLKDFVNTNYDEAFNRALARKGALLLLPEHHLAKARLHYQLRSCISKLADIIQENKLTVISCEQEEKQDLGLEGGILVQGFIDMLLCDKNGNDVVFDLKWTSRKDKHKKILEKNRALQLAIYEAMLMKHTNPSQTVRTAFFVMPAGTLFSKDDFLGSNYEKVPSADADVIIDQLCNGYAERVREINEGRIETADNIPLNELDYTRVENVFPLEDDEKKKDPKKIENKYSDYKCFTI